MIYDAPSPGLSYQPLRSRKNLLPAIVEPYLFYLSASDSPTIPFNTRQKAHCRDRRGSFGPYRYQRAHGNGAQGWSSVGRPFVFEFLELTHHRLPSSPCHTRLTPVPKTGHVLRSKSAHRRRVHEKLRQHASDHKFPADGVQRLL